MIGFLVTAFLVAQPVPPATPGASTPTPAAPEAGSLAPSALRNPVQISAKHVEGERNQATLTGDVLVKHRTLDLRCDKMVAFYNEAREVTRVVCTGSVKAVDGDRMARGERAEYDVPTGVLVVTGAPEARQGTTYMRGTKVRLTLGSERLEVENAVILFESPDSPKKRGAGAAKPPAGGAAK